MLVLCGILIILLLGFIAFKRTIPIFVAVVFVPPLVGLLFGIEPQQLLSASVSGIESMLPNMALLLFSIFFFSVIIKSGFFDGVLGALSPFFAKNPLFLMVGTVLITVFVAAGGSTIGSYIVVILSMLPFYRKLGISSRVLGLVVAAAACVGRIFPWTGRTVLLTSITGMDPSLLFQNSYGAMLLGFLGCGLVIAYCAVWVRKHPEPPQALDLSARQGIKKDARFWLNAALYVLCCACVLFVDVPGYMIFLVFGVIAVAVNCRSQQQRKEVFSYAGSIAFPVCLMQIGAGVMMGVFNNCGIMDAMLQAVSAALPETLHRYLPLMLSALSTVLLLGMPFQCLFAVLPVVAGISTLAGASPVACVLPYIILFPLGYAPFTTYNAAIDDLLEQPKGTHLRFAMLPLGAIHVLLLLLGMLFGIF
ncbi:MAG: SLC13 family permease [Christensenellales bacterium]|jgi:CitMHS family citrate-Mg2+:H+ or citrate-Ca2+:H+ symporter